MSETTSAEGPVESVLYEVANEVATITLNRPDLRNVLSIDSLKELHAALERAASDEDVRVVVLTGSGNTFCAGADLKGASESNEHSDIESDNGDANGADQWQGPQAIVKVLKAILNHPKPTIAKVQGHVAGGGNGLVAACDLAVATESAKFAYSEVRIGLAPAVISVVCLRKMHVADGIELFLTGERITAERAREAGLINRVAMDSGELGGPNPALDAKVAAYASMLRKGGPEALRVSKQLLNRVPQMSLDEAFDYTADVSLEMFHSKEAAAGMGAFLKRETAPWDRQD